MDILTAEMCRKRKAIDMAKSSPLVGKDESTSKIYMRASDLRRFEEGFTYQDQGEKKPASDSDGGRDVSNIDAANSGTMLLNNERISEQKHDVNYRSGLTEEKNGSASSSIPSSDIIAKKLRSLGLPIRLFGEVSDVQCYNRYRVTKARLLASKAEIETEEFRLGSGHGIRNPFLEKDKEEDRKRSSDMASISGRSKKGSAVAGGTDSTSAASTAVVCALSDQTEEDQLKSGGGDSNEDKDDPHKRTYIFFKTLLKQWEEDLSRRPDGVRKSLQGKNETKTFKQCKDYIRPLFKLCKSRKLEKSIMDHLLKIVDFCEDGEFVKAHDAYMDLAIGRAAWPIGVTMVGIHARSGRAKIESANVAHVMNSELQRKYLTSVKRLMSYAQKKRDDVAPSKKVL
jgi:pre-mRNA-splicing factor 18